MDIIVPSLLSFTLFCKKNSTVDDDDDVQRIEERIFGKIIYFSGFHRPCWDILFAHWTSIDNVEGLRQTGRMEDMATPKNDD